MRRHRRCALLLGLLLWPVIAGAGTEPANLDTFFATDPPEIDITSFAGRAQRYFEQADIFLTTLAAQPHHDDDAVVALLQQYRQQLLRGRMELARAYAVHQPVDSALVAMERFTGEHLRLLQHLLPELSPPVQRTVRHTLRMVAQLHQSAQASLLTNRVGPETAAAVRRAHHAP